MPALSVAKQFDAQHVTRLYYIFPRQIAKSIESHGILSQNDVKRRGVPTSSFALESAQRIRDTIRVRLPDKREANAHELVPLYFNPCNPTLWRLKHMWNDLGIAVILVSKLCSNIRGWIASDGNLASGPKTRLHGGEDALVHLNWPLLKAPGWSNGDPAMLDERRRMRCAEFLVWPHVPFDCIEMIAVFSHEAKHLMVLNKPVSVRPKLFMSGTLDADDSTLNLVKFDFSLLKLDSLDLEP